MNVYAMSMDTGAIHVTLEEDGVTYDLVGDDPHIDIDMVREPVFVEQAIALPGPTDFTFTLKLSGIKGISRRG